MPIIHYGALVSTVALLMVTTYFLMGGLPLLILKHDTPMDAWFVRGFFRIYYKIAFVAALATATSYALWGRPAFALGAVAIALAVVVLRRKLIPVMEQLDVRIQARHASAVRSFRKVHCMALLFNAAQLVVLVWSTTKLSL